MEQLSNLENELELINLRLSDEQDNLARIEANIESLNAKAATAKELLAEAEAVLAQPPQLGATAEARCDKQQAEKVLASVSEDLPVLDECLKSCKRRLAVAQERKRQFPMDELNRIRKLERLRQECR